MNEFLLKDVKLGQFEVDEIGPQLKKQKKVKQRSPETDEEGDAWIYNS
jgi:hypothetical protein